MFKKTILTLVVTASCVFGFSSVQAAPAVVLNPAGGCGLFDGNAFIVFTTDSRSVSTQSQNQNAVLKCHASVTAPASGTAVRFDAISTGLACFIASPLPPFIIITNDWEETVSASGQATITCRYKN